MAIKVQPFVIDEGVLEVIGNEFRFDHAKGLAEWLKNSERRVPPRGSARCESRDDRSLHRNWKEPDAD